MISFILLNLIIYIPFHLFEEAVGDSLNGCMNINGCPII